MNSGNNTRGTAQGLSLEHPLRYRIGPADRNTHLDDMISEPTNNDATLPFLPHVRLAIIVAQLSVKPMFRIAPTVHLGCRSSQKTISWRSQEECGCRE